MNIGHMFPTQPQKDPHKTHKHKLSSNLFGKTSQQQQMENMIYLTIDDQNDFYYFLDRAP